jgi:hypothetical protein
MQTLKISEHPMQMVHKSKVRKEAADDEVRGMAVESVADERMDSGDTCSPAGPRLGTLMVKAGFITEKQLQEALRAQREQDLYKPVGQILIDQKSISAR